MTHGINPRPNNNNSNLNNITTTMLHMTTANRNNLNAMTNNLDTTPTKATLVALLGQASKLVRLVKRFNQLLVLRV